MNWFAGHVHRYFFTPDKPLPLGMCRLAFFGTAFVLFLDDSPTRWADTPSAWRPTLFFRLGHVTLMPPELMHALSVLWKCSLLTSALGLMTRVSTACAAICGLYFIGLHHCFGKVDHTDALVAVTMIIFACSRCGDAFSIDRHLWRRCPIHASSEYRWPIRLHWLLFALVWLDAGTSKLRASGFAWAFSDNMANMLVAYHYLDSRSHSISLTIAQHAWLARSIAAGSLLLELAAPLLLLGPSLRFVIVAGLLCMQLGIWLLMGINFKVFYLNYLLFVPWSSLASIGSKYWIRIVSTSSAPFGISTR